MNIRRRRRRRRGGDARGGQTRHSGGQVQESASLSGMDVDVDHQIKDRMARAIRTIYMHEISMQYRAYISSTISTRLAVHQTVNRRNLRCCMHVDHQTNKQPTSWFYVVVHSVRVVADTTSSMGRHALATRTAGAGKKKKLNACAPHDQNSTSRAPAPPGACTLCMAAPPAPACMHTPSLYCMEPGTCLNESFVN